MAPASEHIEQREMANFASPVEVVDQLPLEFPILVDEVDWLVSLLPQIFDADNG